MTASAKKPAQKIWSKIRRSTAKVPRSARMSIAVVVFAAIGTILLVSSKAATPTAKFEVEAGTRSGNAALVSDTGASGGSAVKFTNVATSCTVATQHVPGGPDGMGGCWPAAYNTGYPHGLPGDTRTPVTLTNYSGPSGYSDVGTLVIDKKVVNSELRFYGYAKVTITNSLIKGNIDFDLTDTNSSLTISDSEIDVGGGIIAGIGNRNWTGTRIDVHGATTGASCAGNCYMRDSYLHGNYLPPDADYHLGGYLSNGGSNINVIHSSIFCDAGKNSFGGNCSGDLNMFGDFAPISYAFIDSNLFGANIYNSYCSYAGEATPGSKPYPKADHVVYQNNIFQRGTNGKCADYGPITSFNPANPGNQWINNKWDDGTILQSAN